MHASSVGAIAQRSQRRPKPSLSGEATRKARNTARASWRTNRAAKAAAKPIQRSRSLPVSSLTKSPQDAEDQKHREGDIGHEGARQSEVDGIERQRQCGQSRQRGARTDTSAEPVESHDARQ